jgi:hypothetical protein
LHSSGRKEGINGRIGKNDARVHEVERRKEWEADINEDWREEDGAGWGWKVTKDREESWLMTIERLKKEKAQAGRERSWERQVFTVGWRRKGLKGGMRSGGESEEWRVCVRKGRIECPGGGEASYVKEGMIDRLSRKKGIQNEEEVRDVGWSRKRGVMDPGGTKERWISKEKSNQRWMSLRVMKEVTRGRRNVGWVKKRGRSWWAEVKEELWVRQDGMNEGGRRKGEITGGGWKK